MQLVYKGPHLEVEVPMSEVASIVATRGEPVEVPKEVAESLLSHGEGGNDRPWSLYEPAPKIEKTKPKDGDA